MKRMCAVALALMLLWPRPALAQEPTLTPTPTLLPIPPTPTSMYLWLHESPTPLPTYSPKLMVTFDTDSQIMADTTINIYRRINADHIIDFAMLFIAIVISIGYLIRFIGKGTKDI